MRPGAGSPTRMATVVALALALLAACSGGGSGEGDVSVTFRIEPRPPVVGSARLELRLIDPAGGPIPGAGVQVEANMNHAGMQPTFSTLEESAPGLYAGPLEFTMGGDWFLLVVARLDDGREIERRLDVPGVRSE